MAAPKGNKFAVGNSGGSKIWESPEQLQIDIDAYFYQCDNNTEIVFTKEGIKVEQKDPIPYTVEGLCEVLDCDRDTLLNYQKKEGYEEFFGTIKKAKNKIARNKIERGLMNKSNPAVTIFDLKNNHGYKDKSEQDFTTKGDKLGSGMTDEEFAIKVQEAQKVINAKT